MSSFNKDVFLSELVPIILLCNNLYMIIIFLFEENCVNIIQSTSNLNNWIHFTFYFFEASLNIAVNIIAHSYMEVTKGRKT